MRNRDYTQEIGIASAAERPVSTAVSIAIFALIVVVALLFARQVNGLKHVTAETTGTPATIKVSSR